MNGIEYINLTPHAVNVMPPDGQPWEVPASGQVARIRESLSRAASGDPHAPTIVFLSTIEGLPEPREGVIYVVSMPVMMVLAATGDPRMDCRYPFDQVRDDKGRIVGCRELADLRFWPTPDSEIIRRALRDQGTSGGAEYTLLDRMDGAA